MLLNISVKMLRQKYKYTYVEQQMKNSNFAFGWFKGQLVNFKGSYRHERVKYTRICRNSLSIRINKRKKIYTAVFVDMRIFYWYKEQVHFKKAAKSYHHAFILLNATNSFTPGPQLD